MRAITKKAIAHINVSIVLLSIIILSAKALAIDCKPLIPTKPVDVEDQFSGKITGEIDGLFARVMGAKADIEGSYKHIAKSVIDKFPEADRLKQYMWERVLYLQCEVLSEAHDLSSKEKLSLVGELYQKFSQPAPQIDTDKINSKIIINKGNLNTNVIGNRNKVSGGLSK